MKTKKAILLSLAAIILIGIFAGFYMYNKGPVNVKNSHGVETTSTELYQSFITDSSAAQKRFVGKIVEVNGTISSIEKNAKKEAIVLLETNEPGAHINCTMEENVTLRAGQQLTIKGICSGLGQGDADLGLPGDVYLTRCYISN